MCSLRRLTVAVALSCGALPAAAQTMADQQERVAALSARLGRLVARLDSLQGLDDTVYVDGVGFVVKPEHRARAEEAARLALTELERMLGRADRRLLDGWVSTELRNGWADEDDRARAVADVVRAAGDDRLFALSGRQLRPWIWWWSPEEGDLARAHLDLVTSPSAAATACFEGDIRWCARVLRIETVDDPWTQLLDAADRRVWVANRMRWVVRGPQGEEHAARLRRCVDGRVDKACLDLLHVGWVEFPPLVSAQTMRSVVLVARDVGGEGAYTRLLADTTAPLGDRLAAAAGVPLDSLLHVWRARVGEAAPAGGPVGSIDGWASFALALLAGALSLRSTRWR
jgi:hypothetical protein